MAGMSDFTTKTSRLFIFDRISGLKFLIDSGSDVSVLPRRKSSANQSTSTAILFAANNTRIPAFGTANLGLDLGLRRNFFWTFMVADVNVPILGADFLSHFDLVVDLRKQRLVDQKTSLVSQGTISGATQFPVTTVSAESPYAHILAKFPDITNPCLKSTAVQHDTVHHIQTKGPPVISKPRRLHPKVFNAVRKEFEFLLEQGVVRPSKSNWSSPLHIVSKKPDSIRVVGDYRKLNSITTFDSYPIPYLQDFSAELHGTTIFSKLDIFKAYHHIPILVEDIPKTAVTTPWGLYEYTHLCFGLVNAAQTFMRFMHEVLRGLDFCYVYLDDILCFSKSAAEHKEHLSQILERLHRFGLKLNMMKCVFGVTEIEFLGHLITSEGTRPLPEKVQAILDFKQPDTVGGLRKFLGLLNFYRRFLHHAAASQALLHNFLKGSQRKKDKKQILWTPETVSAFNNCKKQLANATLLAHPDQSAKLVLYVDASDIGLGGALHQLAEKDLQPLGFFSRRLTPAESRYSAYDRELLAAYSSIRYFRHMLEAREFILYTDHKPLTYAFQQKIDKCSPSQIRQLDFISQFTTDIRHVKGDENIPADIMSRIGAITFPFPLDYTQMAKDQEHDEDLQKHLNSDSSLKLRKLPLPNTDVELFCDVSAGNIRPFVPETHRRHVFDSIHNLAHTGIKATTRSVTDRFVWSSVNKDCRAWTRCCVPCQRSKIQKHTRSPLGIFGVPSERFMHVHIDIIGPLPPSNGFTYCVTMVDRFTRWIEAVPVADITAVTIAKVFFTAWVSRFGVPLHLTCDQGRQFESQLFKELATTLGCKINRTTAFNPKANGILERIHRPLKAAIRCYQTERWTDVLPCILLGMPSAFKEDIGATSAELVYGSTVRIPGEFFTHSSSTVTASDFVVALRNYMQKLQPTATANHSKTAVFVHKDLRTCTPVFIRRKEVRRPLQPPFDGPFKVLNRADKFFTVQLPNRKGCRWD